MIKDLGLLPHVDAALLDRQGTTLFEFEHDTPYIPGQSSQRLQVLINRTGDDLQAILSAEAIEGCGNPQRTFDDIARDNRLNPVKLSDPLPLGVVHIPKPWGQEIWYSGIEARGVSTAGGVPLPWLTDVFAGFLQCPRSPLLLKTLDPYPETNLGDLYFEMHEEKVEVYVVTHIDSNAWPDGVGAIRYGFNPERLADYQDRETFLAAYLEAVSAYREVRQEVDQFIGQLIAQKQLELPLSPDVYNDLLDQLPNTTSEKEKQRRESMYEFTAMRKLRIGDVVTVKPYFPHSLQHGVRVIEFQTPHYERYILSFGQQVLTQPGWDTEAAAARVTTSQPAPEELMEIAAGHSLIADFNEFRVHRVEIPAGGSLETRHAGYTLVTGVAGTAQLENTTIAPEQAFLLRPRHTHHFSNEQREPAVVLVAEECD